MKKEIEKKSGFTLIELLVVISIIALLSTVVLGSVGEAREKGINSSINSTVREYITALELYKNDHNGLYPEPSTSSPVCLENQADDACLIARNNDSDYLLSIGNYIQNDSVNNDPVIMSTNDDISGATYECQNECTDFIITWYLNSQSASCPGGLDSLAVYGVTRCSYDSSEVLRN